MLISFTLCSCILLPISAMAHKDGLVQEIQSQLDQDMKEIGKEPAVDVGSTNVTIGASVSYSWPSRLLSSCNLVRLSDSWRVSRGIRV